jgi:preprotein translocase subunit SecF
MKKFNFVQYNRIFLGITLVLIVLSVAAVGIFGLKLGIDFKGGTIFEYKNFNIPVEKIQVEGVVFEKKVDLPSGVVKLYFDKMTEAQVLLLTENINKIFDEQYASVEVKPEKPQRLSYEIITSQVAEEQSRNAIQAVAIASLGIILFLSISFAKVPKPFSSWEFGVSAVLALLHDAIIVIGAFAVFGHYFHTEIDTLFITAILTVIGFSVHDTIVVFDRLRENLIERGAKEYKIIINDSLSETIGRSLSLTITAVLVLISMYYLGAESLKWFVLALLIGMISGTYSSIFVATQILEIIQEVKLKYFKRKYA